MTKNFYDETDDLPLYWDLRYQEWLANPNWGIFKEKDRWFETRMGHLLPPANDQKNGVFRAPIGRVLEFGCGNAMYSVPLLRRFSTYYGVDTSPTALEIAHLYLDKEHPDGNRILALSDESGLLSFPDGFFDCVMTITVLQHQPVVRRLAMIEEIKRVLKPWTGAYLGLEWSDSYSRAHDMPPIDTQVWIDAWLPLVIERDVPAEHPEWLADNVWRTRWTT